jgi:hypothetical protein
MPLANLDPTFLQYHQPSWILTSSSVTLTKLDLALSLANLDWTFSSFTDRLGSNLLPVPRANILTTFLQYQWLIEI